MSNKYGRNDNIKVAVDVVVFGLINRDLNILLIKPSKKEMNGRWALPGGLVEEDLSLIQQAENILKRKTGIENSLLDQLATFGNPDRDPFGRVISVAYISLVDTKRFELKPGEFQEDVQWFSIKKTPKLAYDHKEILDTAIKRLAGKMEYTNISQGILDNSFTLTQLQEVYELVLSKKFDKRNFRKKILSLNMVEETGEKEMKTSNRPAMLYKFTDKNIREYQVI